MLRSGGGVVIDTLYLLCYKCCRYSRIPEDWSEAVTVPLYKRKGSQIAAENAETTAALVSPVWLVNFMLKVLIDSVEGD